MLIEQFEEQLDLQVAFVESGKGQKWHASVVGQEDHRLFGCWVLEPNAPKVFMVVLGNVPEFESPRVLRRLQTLRRLSHEQEIKSFFTGDA